MLSEASVRLTRRGKPEDIVHRRFRTRENPLANRRQCKVERLAEEASESYEPHRAIIAAGYRPAPIRCGPPLHESPGLLADARDTERVEWLPPRDESCGSGPRSNSFGSRSVAPSKSKNKSR